MSASWKTVRVFISSTFRDMQAERDHLVRFVFPKLREELLKHRIHLVDVDLRWGVTSDQDALDVCSEVIDECHPRFMCILGGRYGWVPEGKDKSITADEVHYGVLDRDVAKRGRAFFYFRADQATAKMVEEVAGEYREPAGSENAGKLAALKESIKKAGLPVVEFGAQWDKEQKRLTGLEKFGERVHDDLLQSLKGDPDLADHFAEDGSTAPDEFAEEAAQMEAFIEERVDQYILGSREPLMNDLLTFANADGTPNILFLTGEPGSGKSALLAKFCRSLPVSASPSLLVSHFVGASTGSTDLRRTLRRLCHELPKAAGNTEPLPLDIKELITHFQKLLIEAAAKQHVVLVFDALNQFDETDGAHWMNWLPRELPSDVRIVASVIAPVEGENEHQTLAILRNRKDARVEALKPLDETDTQAIIEGYLKRYSKRLDAKQIAALKEKPASNLPLYVLTALEELRTLGTYEEITDRIRELPGDARALFGWILKERLAKDPGFRNGDGELCGPELVEKFAACLGVSRHGLSPAELTVLLDPGDPLGNVAALLRLLRPYLMRRGELLDFYHGQFREAAVAAHLDTPEKQRAAHQSVAACLHAFADPHRDGQCRAATPHSLSELPHHQTHAEAWPDLIATLENIFFLEAKVTHGMAFDLAVDFTAAVDALPPEQVERQRLGLLDEALRRDLHFIARHAKDYPQALFQCLWNSCWWYDCPEAGRHYTEGDGHWNHPGEKLSHLLEQWRTGREAARSGFPWLRALRPPSIHLGTAQLAVLCGHEDDVNSANYSPDGRRIVSGSGDKTVRVWDAESGAEIAVLRGHEAPVNCVCYSPDGRQIISGSSDETIRVWDAESGVQLAVLRGHNVHGWQLLKLIWKRAEDLALLQDRTGLVSHLEIAIRIWWRQLRGREPLYGGAVSSVGLSLDGRRIVSGSYDRTVRVWDVVSGAALTVMRGHKDAVVDVCYSPDGRSIVSGSYDRTVRVWDAASGAESAVLRGHDYVSGLGGYSPDGRRIVSHGGGTVQVWDTTRGAVLAELGGHEDDVSCVCYSPDGRRIVTGSGDNTVRVWDAASGAKLAVLRAHEDILRCVSYSPDGRHIVSGSRDGTVRVWNAAGGKESAVLCGHESTVSGLACSLDGQRIVSASYDTTVRVWDVDSGTELTVLRGQQRKPMLRMNEVQVYCVGYYPDGRHVVSGSSDGTVRVWDTDCSAELAVLRGHTKAVLCVGCSLDGRHIFSGSADRTVRVWDANNGEELRVLRGHKNAILTVGYSLDGRRIVSGSYDNTVRVWDAASSTALAVLRGHEDAVSAVSFSPDGRRIVSGSGETMRVWDAQSYECLEVIQGTGYEVAIAAGHEVFPFRLVVRGLETVLEASSTGCEIAWFPDSLGHITSLLKGHLWGGASANHVVLLRLEGA